MIIMLFKEINKRDFDKLALKMFSILSSNMEIINSKETISDDDFSIWLKYQNDHFYIEYRTILQVYPHILARTIRVLAELLKSLACPLIGKMPLQQVFCIREIFSTF